MTRTGLMDPGPLESLADGASHPLSRVALGLRVRVDAILFERPRRECDALGIREDMVLRPMAWVPGGVLVELPDGTTERVDTEIAEFVSVRLRRSRPSRRERLASGWDGEHR